MEAEEIRNQNNESPLFMTTTQAKKRFITTGEGIPSTASPISQAVVAGEFCFVSGQLPVDRDGFLVPGSIAEQTRLSFDNLNAVLKASGFDLDDIVYVDVALLDIADMRTINAVFEEKFQGDRRPARTVYQAAALPLNSLVKLQAVACRLLRAE